MQQRRLTPKFRQRLEHRDQHVLRDVFQIRILATEQHGERAQHTRRQLGDQLIDGLGLALLSPQHQWREPLVAGSALHQRTRARDRQLLPSAAVFWLQTHALF